MVSIKTMGITVINPLFWLTLWFTYRYYLKYEWDKASAEHLALVSLFEGLGAGFLTICLTAIFGLTLRPGPALFLMGPLAMLFSIVHPRFLCLSYGAGIALVLCTLCGISVDEVGICGVVGILHLAEGILVLLFAGQHTVSIYGHSRGKMTMRSGIYRFWPVPVGLLVVLQSGDGYWINMPKWWPILSLGSEITGGVLGLIPLAVSLGYSDLSGKQLDVKKRRFRNGMLIIGYALILLGLCVTAAKTGNGEWGAVVWMVAGHEGIIVLADLFTKN